MDTAISTRIDGCRSCGSRELLPFLNLGTTVLADRLLTEEQVGKPELQAPLEAAFCRDCSLVQILDTVKPEILFCEDYPYFSSVSPSLIAHFATSAQRIMQRRRLGPNDLVVEAASNDGYMLGNFLEAGIDVLGIDPASGPVQVARNRGIETLETFFSRDLARSLVQEGRTASVFLANNVLAHVPDLNGFVEGVADILREDGLAVIECPYVVDLVDHVEFDTIYHQHLCHFSLTALDALFRRHGLHLNDVERLSIHGGSLRLFVEKAPRPSRAVEAALRNEQQRGVTRGEFYTSFADRVLSLKAKLVDMLGSLRMEGRRIAGYGAAAKGCTMLAFCGIGPETIEYIADMSRFKQGRYMSGIQRPIVSPQRLVEDVPDYTLILAWNFAREIISQQSEYRQAGGRFIIPVPNPEIV